ncbi:uncharacterized protein LOC144713990 [Wolffia australiana]
MGFESPSEFIAAVKNYAVWNGLNLKFPQSSKKKVEVVCTEGCPWRIYASWTYTKEVLIVKNLNDVHRCSRASTCRQASYQWIADHLLEKFRLNMDWKVADMVREINEQFGITVTMSTCYRARSAARKMLQGTLDDHYHLLPSYVAELKKVNRRSTFELVLDRDGPDSLSRFKRLYICFESLARGFVGGCRRLVALDGCFLKTEMKGQLLSAVGKDGNNQMFPIAWAMNLFWAAVKCTTIEKFRRIIREMTALKPEAAQDFVNVGVQKFCRAYISEWSKCETIDNNICECFNSYILQFRSLPIIDMLEGIRSTIMERIVRMRELFSNRTDQLCPRIKEMVERNKLESRTCFLKPAGCRQFEVSNMRNRFVVDLRAGTCSCRYWRIRGVPCCHAIACIHWNKEDPADYVVDWLKRDAYELAYSHGIAPMNGKNMWVEVEGNYVFPPLVKRTPGRPKQRRRVDISEKELKGRNFGKKGVPMKCSLCQQVGHNRKTCIRRRMQAAGQVPEKTNAEAEKTSLTPEEAKIKAQELRPLQELSK